MQSIDSRVVELKFDNAQFEKGISQSVGSLGNLDTAINKLGSQNQMGHITETLDAIQRRTSTLGIVGMSVIQNLTSGVMGLLNKVIQVGKSALFTGGWNRAANIEQAKFQLSGLGVAWEKVREDIDYAVKDTAYGMDVAAKAASQLTASGVKLGDEMKTALRGISGLSAMTNSEYEDMARIFTTVAGNGRLMGDQLLQISSRGINAAATIGKYLGKTEAEVRDMTSKGKIDFATFAAAMDSTFGEHAKKANETFSGAMSNVRAALSRTTEPFYTSMRDSARQVFNALIPVINAINNSLAPVITKANETIASMSKKFISFLESINPENLSKKSDMLLKIFNIFESIGKIIFKVAGAALSGLGPLINGLDTLVDKLLGVVSAVIEAINNGTVLNAIINAIANVSEKIGDIFNDMANAITIAVESVVRAVGKMFNWVKDLFGNTETMLEALNSAGIGVILYSLISLVNGFQKPGEILSKIFDTMSTSTRGLFFQAKRSIKVLDTFRDTFLVWQTKMNADILFKIAIAIGVLSAALKVLSTIDPKRLLSSTAAISACAYILVKAMGELSKLNTDLLGVNLVTTAFAVTNMAIAIFILATAVKKLSSIPTADLVKGVAAVGSLIAIFTLMQMTLSANKIKHLMKGGTSLIFIAYAINILATAVKKISSIETNGLVKGIVSVGVLLAALSAFSTATSGAKGLIPIGLGLLAMSKGIEIISTSVAKIGGLDLKSAVIGVGSIVLLMGALTAMTNLIGKGGNFLLASVGLMIMGKAIASLTKATIELSKIKMDALKKALASLATILGILAISSLALSKTLTVGTAAGLLVMSMAIKGFVTSIMLLSKVPIKALLASLGSMAILFGVIVASTVIISKFAGPMAIAAGVITLVGAASIVLGAGLTAVGAGLTTLAAAFATIIGAVTAAKLSIITVLSSALDTLISLASKIADVFVSILIGVVQAIAKETDTLNKGLIAIIRDGLQALLEFLPKALEMLLLSVGTILETLTQQLPSLVAKGVELATSIVVGFVDGLSNNIGFIINSAFNFIVSFINGLADAIDANAGPIIDAAWKLVTAVVVAIGKFIFSFVEKGIDAVEAVGKGIKSALYKLAEPAKKMVDKVKNTMNKLSPKSMSESGRNILRGLINGLSDIPLLSGIAKAAKKVASVIKNIFNKDMDINSPSGWGINASTFILEGLAIGMSNLDTVTKPIKNVTNAIQDGLAEAMDVAGNAISVSADPTIKPVVDMTDVNRSIADMDRLFKQDRVSTINAQVMNDNNSFEGSMQKAVSNALEKAITSVTRDVGSAAYTLNVPLSIDGREIARATASYTDAELNKINSRAGRKLGTI